MKPQKTAKLTGFVANLKIVQKSHLIPDWGSVFLMYMPVANGIELSGACFTVNLKIAENSYLILSRETVFLICTEVEMKTDT